MPPVPPPLAPDPATGRLFVTGKLWPMLFEIEPVPQEADAEHGGEWDTEEFWREIQPGLQGVSLRRTMTVTGLSLQYCGLVRQGDEVPHPRHWEALHSLRHVISSG